MRVELKERSKICPAKLVTGKNRRTEAGLEHKRQPGGAKFQRRPERSNEGIISPAIQPAGSEVHPRLDIPIAIIFPTPRGVQVCETFDQKKLGAIPQCGSPGAC